MAAPKIPIPSETRFKTHGAIQLRTTHAAAKLCSVHTERTHSGSGINDRPFTGRWWEMRSDRSANLTVLFWNRINRNWRPGAIRLDVAEIFEKVRSGTIGPLPGRNLMKTK
ncbi:hypothetical protein QTP88_029900 [Uroleucon formosanum]